MAKKKTEARPDASGRIVVARNRKVRHDYEILETLEAGLVLRGSEVKVLRSGQGSIAESFARIQDGEAFLVGVHIPEYGQSAHFNHETTRKRKLLLQKRQITKWHRRVTQQGLTIVPVELYFGDRGYAKVELALVRGKKTHDKRQDIKKRDSDREIRQRIRRP